MAAQHNMVDDGSGKVEVFLFFLHLSLLRPYMPVYVEI